jgi:hypothetical protein
MNHSRLSLRILVVVLGALAFTSVAHAQATRTWVSGVGDDANPCSRTAPCKTWAGAISKTAAAGEIDALDPGGFGAVTITKAITLDGGGGQVASVLVAGTNGIVVAAGPSDIVIIRNLRMNGLLGSGNAGINGVSYTSGKQVIIQDSTIFGFGTSCLNASGSGLQLSVTNTVLSNCVIGVIAQNGAHASIRNSSITNSSTAGVQAGPSTGVVDILDSNLSFNSTGAQGNGANSFVNLGNDVITFNSVLGVNSNGGGISTWGDNRFANNTSDGIIPGGGGVTIGKK